MLVLTDVINDFVMYLKIEKNCSVNTIIAYRTDLTKFADYLKENNLPIYVNQISQIHIRSFLHHLSTEHNMIPSTLARKINCFRSFFNFCVDQYYIITSPMKKIKPPKLPKKKPRYLKKGELERLLSCPDKYKHEEHWLRDKAIIHLFAYTGIRRTELINLTWPDVDFKNNLLRVFGKGQKERYIPLRQSLSDLLWEYLQTRLPLKNQCIIVNGKNNIMDYSTLRLVFKKWVTRAGLDPLIVTPHTLRHTFATRLLEEGVDLVTIQELMGHEDPESTLIYTHTNKKIKFEAVEKI